MSHRSPIGRGSLLGLKVLAAALSLTVLVGSGWAWATFRSFTADIPSFSLRPPGPHRDIDGQDQNILLVGNDDRGNATPQELAELGTQADGGSLNTDTMMLLHVPADGRKATIISFPRDTYVSIPGHGKAKLNSAYPTGVAAGHGDKAQGADLLSATIEDLTGLKIDHFVQVGLLGFYRISNAIGGVDLCLNEDARPASSPAEINQPGIDAGWENGQFIPSYTHINLHKGINKNVQGQQALAFVRQRHGLPGGDLDRIKRQQVFLSAVFGKLYSQGTVTNPLRIEHLLKAISSSLSMDDQLAANPFRLADQLQNLTAGNLTFASLPLLPQRPTIDGAEVLLPDTAAIPGFIQGVLGNPVPATIKNAKPADPHQVQVAVVNDTSGNGVENTNAAALRALGFQVNIPAPTAEVLDRTTITYGPGQESAARAVLDVVPGAVTVASRAATGVTLALGDNGVQVKTLVKPGTSSSHAAAPPVITADHPGCVN